jgi:hypothetical protein
MPSLAVSTLYHGFSTGQHKPTREILLQFKGILMFSRDQWGNKELLLDHILANVVEDIDYIEELEQGDMRRRRKLEWQGREKGTTLKIHVTLC